MRTSGSIIWKSDTHYGGSTRFIGGKEASGLEAALEANPDLQRIYIPTRIVIKDVNNDGLPDVLVNKNLESASRVFENMKSYEAGEIHALTWNGIGLTELWRTRKIDGYIVDFLLKQGDGQEAEMLVGIILRRGGLNIVEEPTCTVLNYQLDFSKVSAEPPPY